MVLLFLLMLVFRACALGLLWLDECDQMPVVSELVEWRIGVSREIVPWGLAILCFPGLVLHFVFAITALGLAWLLPEGVAAGAVQERGDMLALESGISA